MNMNRYNIIYINTHDSGRYLSPYGFKVPTPALDVLARKGILMRNAFCCSPTCSPSRGALLTGRYPHSNGLTGLSHRGFSLNNKDDHLGAHLKKAGYHTALAGIEHIANTTLFEQHSTDYSRLPYDEILGPAAEDRDEQNAAAAADFIKRNQNAEQPFFLTLGLWNTHRPYPDCGRDGYEPGYEPDYLAPPSCLGQAPEIREDFAAYCRSVAEADRCVGKVMHALIQTGLEDRTILIFTTDHGLPSPGMKGRLTDDGLGVGLIWNIPGSSLKGRALDGLFSQVDVAPTLLELAGLPRPEGMQGTSYAEQLLTGRGELRSEVFAETNYHCSYEPQRAVRTKDFKYIRRYGTYRRPHLANIDESAPKNLQVQAGLGRKKLPEEELYNLKLDPQEKQNLAEEPESRRHLLDMRKRLDAWMRETGDAPPENGISHPRGTAINPPESLSPKDGVSVVGEGKPV